jgi:hypothetical protein
VASGFLGGYIFDKLPSRRVPLTVSFSSTKVVKIAKPTVETIEGTPDLEQFVW